MDEAIYALNAECNAMQDEIARLEDENKKLRELAGLLSVINKYMSLCATTDCGQCPVKEECEESTYLEGLLGIDSKELNWRVRERIAIQAENEKLRKLVIALQHCRNGRCNGECPMFTPANNIRGVPPVCEAYGVMRKLGIKTTLDTSQPIV